MLSSEQKKLLEELFEAESSTVNLKKFRAKHEKLRSEIDALEQLDFINKKQQNNTEFYSMNLIALNEISSDRAASLLLQMSPVFLYLRNQYKNNPDVSIRYSDVSLNFRIPHEVTELLLGFIHDLSFWGSWSFNSMYPYSSNFTLNESILDYETFQEALDELIERTEEKLKRSKQPNISLNDLFEKNKSQVITPATSTNQALKWPKCTPNIVEPILREVSISFEHKLYALTVMGLRAVIDMIGNEVAGDVRFEQKIDTLVVKNLLTDSQKDILNSALEAGHAAAHRGHIPEMDDAERVADIVHHLLMSVYGTQHKEKLDESTPKRERKR